MVTLSVGVRASVVRAATFDHTIGQRGVACHTELLVDSILVRASFLVKSHEDILSDLGLFLCGSSTKNVEVAVEPLINLLVDLVVVITDLLRCLTFLACFCLCSSAILVGAANIDRVVSSEAAKSCVDVRGKNAPNNIAKMRHVVHVR